MRSFRELRLVIDSLMGSMRSMMWTAILILTVTFMFSLCFVEAAAQYIKDLPNDAHEEREEILLYWRSVPQAMLSIYKASTGGVDWGDAANPLSKSGTAYYLTFCVYVAWLNFVVANCLTALFLSMACHAMPILTKPRLS